MQIAVLLIPLVHHDLCVSIRILYLLVPVISITKSTVKDVV